MNATKALCTLVMAGALVPVGAAGPRTSGGPPVRRIAAMHDRSPASTRLRPRPPILGTALNDRQISADGGAYVRTLLSHFSSVTPEYEMDMAYLEPRPGRFTFGRADRIVDFAVAHGLAIRGHALVWDQLLPPWITTRTWTRPRLVHVLRSYIGRVVGHYRGRVGAWDVINEPLTARGRLRRSIWERVIGPSYIPIALRAAHRADPRARLFINDYGLGWPDRKERSLLRLIRRLRSRGVPLDGIGLEAHYDIADHPTLPQLRGVLRTIAATGVTVELTELDVTTLGPGSLRRRLRMQARVYAIAGAACREVAACTRITTWGITDKDSWRGRAERALPFNASYHAKPAWHALVESIRESGSQR